MATFVIIFCQSSHLFFANEYFKAIMKNVIFNDQRHERVSKKTSPKIKCLQCKERKLLAQHERDSQTRKSFLFHQTFSMPFSLTFLIHICRLIAEKSIPEVDKKKLELLLLFPFWALKLTSKSLQAAFLLS